MLPGFLIGHSLLVCEAQDDSALERALYQAAPEWIVEYLAHSASLQQPVGFLAQAGSFIIAGLDDVYINKSLMYSRTKEFHARIILTNKKAIFEELKLLNINDSTMLPDLQRTGEYTRSLFS